MLPKKKIQTGILLAGVLLVWGLIAVRFCKDFWGGDAVPTQVSVQKDAHRDTVTDAYALHIYTRDPFLSVLTDTASTAAADTPVVAKAVAAPRPIMVLPEYCGTVQNKEECIAIVRIQDKFYFLKRSERLNDWQVTAIADDTLTLSAAGVRYRIGLKHNGGDNRQASR